MVEGRGVPEMDMYMARQQQHLDDDGDGSSMGEGGTLEKGRGSYKCGRVSEMFGCAFV
jgi:hypothetical protein